MTGCVYLIGAGPGDPGLLTLKAKRYLEQSDVVIYDRLVTKEILAFVSSQAEQIYVGKETNQHTVAQEEINALLIEKALSGHIVSRLKGGDPFVFGRGSEEALALVAKEIPFEIVPGISSAIAVPAYAGIPLTHRTLASGFHVITGHECFHSSEIPWETVALSSQTLVILMGIGHLQKIVKKLAFHGRSLDTPVAIIRWGTTTKQEVIVGTLLTIAALAEEFQIKPPSVIVVGEVVRLRDKLQWFEPLMEASR